VPGRAEMLEGFTGVVDSDEGTAFRAFQNSGLLPGQVSGKTGTAQVEGRQNTSWFVGMTPAMAPKYIVLAVVEEGGYGSATSAPIVRRIMQGLNGLPPAPVAILPPARGN